MAAGTKPMTRTAMPRRNVIAAAGSARLYDLVRLLRDPRSWSELTTRLRLPSKVHQDCSLTWPDRYPALFSAARTLLVDRPRPRILSFGCSSGEEVLTLRRYFPDAVIVGAEINQSLLRACRRHSVEGETLFIHSTPEAIQSHGPFDAIFCMAVFTRRPHEVERRNMGDISRFYPFGRFADTVRHLAAQLTEGGLLVVEHGLYRVEDAIEGLPVTPVATHGFRIAKGPRFDPSGARLDTPQLVARIFCREGA